MDTRNEAEIKSGSEIPSVVDMGRVSEETKGSLSPYNEAGGGEKTTP